MTSEHSPDEESVEGIREPAPSGDQVEPSPAASEARIRDRAYLISQGAGGGSPEENWRRAELELAEEDENALAAEIAQRAKEAAFRAAMTHP